MKKCLECLVYGSIWSIGLNVESDFEHGFVSFWRCKMNWWLNTGSIIYAVVELGSVFSIAYRHLQPKASIKYEMRTLSRFNSNQYLCTGILYDAGV